MKTVKLADVCGTEVLSRANVRKLYDEIDEDIKEIDLTGVTFISRSVADELCNISDHYPAIEFIGKSEDVEMMLRIVSKGRNHKRTSVTRAKVSVTVNCETMEDLRKALLSFGA